MKVPETAQQMTWHLATYNCRPWVKIKFNLFPVIHKNRVEFAMREVVRALNKLCYNSETDQTIMD